MKTRRILFLAVVLALVSASAWTDPASLSAKLQRATQLTDDYFGDHRGLDEAAALISQVLAENNRSAQAFVQAARITVKGGHVVSGTFQPGTIDLTERFVDRALEIDPENVAAISIKAELYLDRNDLPRAFGTLQAGLMLAPNYPWFHIHLAQYYEHAKERARAIAQYRIVVDRGPDADNEQKRAYPGAVMGIADLVAGFQGEGAISDIRAWAVLADHTRNPKDAWIPNAFAEIFAEKGFFDDALIYSRKALSVMDFGVGRRTLAMTLYGKSAQLSNQGRDYSALVKEANSMNVSRADIVSWFGDAEPNVAMLLPIVLRFLPTALLDRDFFNLPAT